MEGKVSSDQEILELCTRAIEAEGEKFEAAIADLRKAIHRTSHNLENATLASVIKLSRGIKASQRVSAEKQDEGTELKRAA
jgi:hypothetical protein